MTPLSIVGIFCEDIRAESSGTFTLIGVLPDNVRINALGAPRDKSVTPTEQPRMLSKLCIYTRANFDPDDPVAEISLKLCLPGDHEISIGGAAPDIILQAKDQAKKRGNLLAGVFMRSVLEGFKLAETGVIRLDAIIGEERRPIAALNFQVGEASVSSEPPQPSRRSPGASSKKASRRGPSRP